MNVRFEILGDNKPSLFVSEIKKQWIAYIEKMERIKFQNLITGISVESVVFDVAVIPQKRFKELEEIESKYIAILKYAKQMEKKI